MRPHFLEPLVHGTPAGFALRNRRNGRFLAVALETAFDSASRRQGLLGRDNLAAGVALIIAPCQAVHTFGMRFPLDLVFASRAGRVVRLRRQVPRRRIAGSLAAFAVIELPAGAIDRADLRAGDDLECVSHAPGLYEEHTGGVY